MFIKVHKTPNKFHVCKNTTLHIIVMYICVYIRKYIFRLNQDLDDILVYVCVFIKYI